MSDHLAGHVKGYSLTPNKDKNIDQLIGIGLLLLIQLPVQCPNRGDVAPPIVVQVEKFILH